MSVYLSVCAIYRDEASYLREWIEVHRLVGVERFFLYNNRSADDHREILAPYVEDGIAVVRDWPIHPAQLQAYDDCLKRHQNDSRWIAFIDLDEFLFSPTGRPVPEVLRNYEQWPGVVVNWAIFGTSGHVTRPSGLVIENYTNRSDGPSNLICKSIVQPARTACAGKTPHWFKYLEGFAVDENGRQATGPPFNVTQSVSFSRLRVNHYATKSEQEYRAKIARGMADRPGKKRQPTDRDIKVRKAGLNSYPCADITMYLPALHEALRAVEQRTESSSDATRPSADAGAL